MRSYRVHGKGNDKYDNIRIGLNSRLDTLQAAVLQVKLNLFREYELNAVNIVAKKYGKELSDRIKVPGILEGYLSSWAQYSILCKDSAQREIVQRDLKRNNIPSMVYYCKPLHMQEAFRGLQNTCLVDLGTTNDICQRVLSLPVHPYLRVSEIEECVNVINSVVDM